MKEKVAPSIYETLGASSSKKGVHEALEKAGSAASHAHFAEVRPDVTGDPEYYSLLHADGAGTKAIVAYLAYRESGDFKYFRSLAQDSLAMNLDDVACVGAFESLLLSNTIGRNLALIPDRAIAEIVDGYREQVALLSQWGIPIALCGGETADLGDLVRTLVVDSTLFARVRRDTAISTNNIRAGDIIVGISNSGKAKYETHPNSSMGSNGLTLARHALIHRDYARKYPEIVSPESQSEHVYRGHAKLFDEPNGLGMSVAAALLSPTRLYAPIIKKLLTELPSGSIHGSIHCSGGGLSKVVRFGQNKRYVKDNLFAVPPLFSLIQEALSVPWREMYTVFNMGHRLELYCPAEFLKPIEDTVATFGIEAKQIGYVDSGDGTNSVELRTSHGVFEYR